MNRSNGHLRKRTQIHLFGVGRSGTSWLMKIFDHHPDLLALHEPEGPLRSEIARLKRRHDVGPVADDNAATRFDHRALRHLLFEKRPLRAVRRRPIIRKAYRSRLAHMARIWIIYAASGVGKFGPRRISKSLKSLNVPDLGDTPDHILVKSVSRMDHLDAYIQANPDLNIIFMIRHPCANVSSILEGQAKGLMSQAFRPSKKLIARYFDGDPNIAHLSGTELTMTEILSVRWAVYNQLMQDLDEKYANVSLIVYEDLCDDPIGVSKDLFAKVGLGWHPCVENFIRASLLTVGTGNGYHAVIRDPGTSKERWRTKLSPEDQETIIRITSQVPVARLFSDVVSCNTDARAL